MIEPRIDIVTALRQGDSVVFKQLFDDYYERLCNYANSFLDDIDESEEVVQATFIALWEKRDKLDIQISVKSYLYQAVHNQSLNKIKHDRVKQAHFEYITYQNNVEAHDGYQSMIEKELAEKIRLAIESLPQQCRLVFTLSRFENLSYADIATQLNLSVKTVENHIGKALRIMRTELSDYLPLLIWLLLPYF